MKKQQVLSLLLVLSLLTVLLTGCQKQTLPVVETVAPTETVLVEETIPPTAESSPEPSKVPEKAPSYTLDYADAVTILLSSQLMDDGTWTHSAEINQETVAEYDYCWHSDLTSVHEEVKNAPSEYFTGTQSDNEAVYIAHDITYFPEVAEELFQKTLYDGEYEWAAYYPVEEYENYIFATLPYSNGTLPTGMMHSESEAWENAVLHITKPGKYVLEGTWHGQILVDLGDSDDTFTDETAKVTLILNGVDVSCTVAPAIIFNHVYECDNGWEDRTDYGASVDTENAGANVVIADGSENTFSGANVYRMLKAKYKDDEQEVAGEEAKLQKKMRKTDGAFYSYQSMNIYGEIENTGILNIISEFEGLDTELHLTINGGNVNIYSQDDGINVNEDGVSVLTVNGGNLHILAGLGSEGDGVDSNGYLCINGGTVISMANPASDSGLDSDCGSYINGGTVVALGSTMDWAETDDSSSSTAATMNLQFSGYQSSDEALIVTNLDGTVVFAYDPDQDEVAGSRVRSYRGAILSCPEFRIGESYHVYVGGNVVGTESAGIYDASTVTGFSSDAVQQCYYGTFQQMGMPGEMPEGEMPPTGRNDGERPENPEGFGDMGGSETPPNLPFGNRDDENAPPEMPLGNEDGGITPPDMTFGELGEGGQRPDDPFGNTGDGTTPPDRPSANTESGSMGGFENSRQLGIASEEFFLEDSVNNFSSVSDIQ